MKWSRTPEQQRAVTRACRAEGICICCKKRLAIHSFCGVCLEHRAEAQARRKAGFISMGKCSRCGGERDNPGRRMCAKCRKYQNRVKTHQVAA